MAQNIGPVTFVAGEDLLMNRRVKIESGTTSTPPEVVYADAGEEAIGLTVIDASDGDPVSVRSLVTDRKLEATCSVSSAIARGTKLYGAADGKISDAPAGKAIGIALEAGVDTALCEFFSLVGSESTKIADPGDAEAIPVTASGVVPITTAGAETRTIAIPTVAGQRITLVMDVDGGDCVVTVAAAINQTGNNTITLNDAGDTVELVAVQVAGALVWRSVFNDGATLSTV